ncbi:MAG: PadR family transcriptional regulator [Cyclobacteriaceae bacterium]|nr:PadR family transcriptional regulator [Cyclobacteriaceae bacterium]
MYSKELLKGTLSTIILKLLTHNDKMYGYEIAQRVKILSKDKILIKEGSLYPALHKLKDDGLVDTEKEMVGNRMRKYYFLTEKGRVSTLEKVDELNQFISTLQSILIAKPQPS